MFGDPIENPKSWRKLQLQNFVSADCSISYGIVKPGDDVPGGVPVFRPVDIVGRQPVISEMKRTTPEISNQYKRTLLTGRELLITVRANIADTYIIDESFKDCNVGRGIVPIRTNEEVMRLEFLKGQMDYDSLHEHIKSQAKGIALIQLNMEDLRKIEFIIPPVELQDEYIAFMTQSDKSKFTGFKSQFIEEFGDPVDNPMGWPMRKLSDVAKVDGTMTKEYEKYADYPHIGIDSIEKNTGILSGYRTVQEDNVISPKYYFGPQHILYSKIRPALNKVALPNFEGLGSADCYPLLVTGMCDRKFLAHMMRSDYFLDYVLSYSGRSQMPKVNRKQLEGFSFPCPPIELQEKFTVLIDQSDKSK